MTPEEFARRHFPNHRIRGDEIQPVYCPYCGGGDHGDKFTAAMNIQSGAFNCKRGSCGVTKSFVELCRDQGEVATRMKTYETTVRQKVYKAPATEVKPATSAVEKYLRLRGFSPETWQKYGVGDDGKGNIIFPYYENGALVMLKFRPARKIKKGEKNKCWREDDGKPVLWGMDLCTPGKPLAITEGEPDTLALAECGIENVVSVPSGAEDLTFFDLCWDWLQQFRKVIIWVDSDGPGQELQRKLINRLGAWRCWVVKSSRKDANEVLVLDGKQAVIDAYNSAVEVPIAGLIRLADVKPFDYSSAVRTRTGIRGLDKKIGGSLMGEFTIWTGINASGKSVILGQVLLEAVEQGYAVCAYSGELPAAVFRYWIDLQAAGPRHLAMRHDEIKESDVAYPAEDAQKLIRNWYRDKFFLYDSYGTATDDSLFEIFSYAAQRYNCKVFLIDNLMTVDLSTNEQNYFRQQSQFVNKVAQFAQQYDCHVHLVAHPRKAQGRLTKMDVSGSGDITNRANNVFSVYRLPEQERVEKDCDAILEIFKNRFYGAEGTEIQLKFDQGSRRFYMASEKDGHMRPYGWEKQQLDDFPEPDFDDQCLPF